MTRTAHTMESALSEMLGEDRRSDVRHTPAPRIASLEAEGRMVPCMIRNISNGGVMASLLELLPVGLAVKIRLRDRIEVSGTIVWAVEDRIGIRFDNEVDALALA